MTKDEALKLALEALKRATNYDPVIARAITAIKEALAQPEQEPVAFVKGCNKGQWEIFPAKAYQIFEREQPLYTTPPDWRQPQRKPLTDEEIRQICVDNWGGYEQARAIEAAHGIKGGA